MPRSRLVYRRIENHFPSDFPLRLEHLKVASGLSWRGLARRLGTETRTVRRWRKGQLPSPKYMLALFSLAESLQGTCRVLACPRGPDM
jgi:DNA-binding transcriptional regulator YiaG